MLSGERWGDKDGNITERFSGLKFEEIFRARNGMNCHKARTLLKKEEYEI